VPGGGTVTIPTGQTGADVALQAPVVVGADFATPVTVTASTADASFEAKVRIVGAAEAPKLVAIDPASVDLFAGDQALARVVLDLPALAGPMDVALAIAPEGIATVPAAVTVAQFALDAMFNLDAVAAGDATLTATAGDDFLNAAVHVTEKPTDPVMPSSPGDVLVTEYMAKSQAGSGDPGEWIELYNDTESLLDLGGCVLKDDGTNVHAIVGPLVMGPGQYLVLGASTDPALNHHAGVVYAYGTGFQLANTDDEVILDCGTVIDKVAYTSSASAVQAVSRQLDPTQFDSVANDAATSWCASTGVFYTDTASGVAYKGTPGTANVACQ
jgi:hypothetical protein